MGTNRMSQMFDCSIFGNLASYRSTFKLDLFIAQTNLEQTLQTNLEQTLMEPIEAQKFC